MKFIKNIKEKNFFSDKKCILKGINSKNKKLFKNWKANILHEQCNLNSVSKNLKINKASINSKLLIKMIFFLQLKDQKMMVIIMQMKQLKKVLL